MYLSLPFPATKATVARRCDADVFSRSELAPIIKELQAAGRGRRSRARQTDCSDGADADVGGGIVTLACSDGAGINDCQ